MMSGGAWAPGTLFKAGLADTDLCPLCGDQALTIAHYLYECTACADARSPAVAAPVGNGSSLPACLRHFCIPPALAADLSGPF